MRYHSLKPHPPVLEPLMQGTAFPHCHACYVLRGSRIFPQWLGLWHLFKLLFLNRQQSLINICNVAVISVWHLVVLGHLQVHCRTSLDHVYVLHWPLKSSFTITYISWLSQNALPELYMAKQPISQTYLSYLRMISNINTVKCHYNACHYNANASLTRSILGSQTAPTCPHDHPRVAQHMVYRCEIIAVWSATAAMTPLCSHTNGMKQRHPTCWLCQCSRFMIDLRSNTLIIHLRGSENAINRPIWLTDARMLKTISVAIKLT